MKANRWQMGVNILLIVALLVLAVFTRQLNSRHNQLSQDLASTKDSLKAADAAMSQEVSRQGTALSADIATTRSQLQQAKTQLETADTALSTDIKAAQTRLQEVKTQLEAADAALSQEVSRQGTALSADIATTRSQLQQAKTQLEAADTALSTDIKAAQTRLQEVKTQLEAADTALSQEVSRQGTALSADIETERSRIQALQTQTSELSTQMDRALIDVEPLYAKVKDSIVEVWAWDGEGWGQGSGFLYGSEKRYVITAHHMVDGARSIYVVTVGGVEITASLTLVATNTQKDLAVLRLNSPLNATPLTLGDSSKVAVGEPVLLVGSPFGRRGSASAGIVSGVNREVYYGEYFVADMIQYDAASNLGSSGSPLINAKGEVIGMDTTGINIAFGWGISYAVPASSLKELVSILPP